MNLKNVSPSGLCFICRFALLVPALSAVLLLAFNRFKSTVSFRKKNTKINHLLILAKLYAHAFWILNQTVG
uniref:Uncharacterized protein n=1 Tax=Anopheles darlingi TaxID=43151 RepID=A0A2M4DEZ2_ANODA